MCCRAAFKSCDSVSTPNPRCERAENLRGLCGTVRALKWCDGLLSGLGNEVFKDVNVRSDPPTDECSTSIVSNSRIISLLVQRGLNWGDV